MSAASTKKVVVPIGGYVAVALLALLSVDTAFRVYVQLLICLAVALLLPALLAAKVSSTRKRLLICIAAALSGIISCDAALFLVLTKAEPFNIIRNSGWAYAFGTLAFTSLSFCAAWIAAPPSRNLPRLLALAPGPHESRRATQGRQG